MTRAVRQGLLVLVALAFVALGVTLGLGGRPAEPSSDGTTVGVVLLALVAVVLALRKVWGSLDTSADAPATPWAPDEPFATPAPERTDRNPPLSSDEFTAVIETAGAAARDGGTVADGLAVVRPPLRETLLDALEHGGHSRSEAEAMLADGTWTDDRIAASVLDERVRAPVRSRRERLRAWLFPERVVRRRAGRAMAAVAEAADDALPAVPGQTAPRTVPVLQPRLEDLRRGADGRLQRAVDPGAIARGPRPPRAGLEADDCETATDDRNATSTEVTDA
ncbi:DUF7269 family protein [Halopiger djelfimassiliensis]|uniref:DUF7269 family protein n=1 Tax=Halopiger djelfimassiliensis TaxID=1293047 RepID=UPI000677BB55|nr:hypothetical protein [Halopiger djelfimassiliensis]